MKKLGVVAVVAVLCVLLAPVRVDAGTDALQDRTMKTLNRWISWLEDNDVNGFLGEFGWPDDARGTMDSDQWNQLADRYLSRLDDKKISSNVWATGEWWGDYPLAVYEAPDPDHGGVHEMNTQAPTFEAHPTTPDYFRAIDVSTGGFCEPPGLKARSTRFSNRHPGVYGHCYKFDTQKTFDYLASRGITTVKIEFRWETIQRHLFGPLHGKSMARLRAVVHRAENAGLHVILDMHNFGAYYVWNGEAGVRRPIGSKKVRPSDFADVWRRLSNVFKNDHKVGYAIMCEPVGMHSSGGRTAAEVWEAASRRTVRAIRGTGDSNDIFVSGYSWAAAQGWAKRHPDPWIAPGIKHIYYEAHHYWDRDSSGTYAHTYNEEVNWAQQAGR